MAGRLPAQVDRLEHQMAEEEAEVERRVAGVGALEIQEDQAAGVDQDVLGAEVAQDECALGSGNVHRGDQGVDPRGDAGMGAGDRAVVGIDPQLIEQGGVGQGLVRGAGCPGASAWIVPRMVPSCAAISGIGLARPSGGSSRSPNRPAHRSWRTGTRGDPRRGPRARCRVAGSRPEHRARPVRPRSGRAVRASPWPPAAVRGTA